MYVHVHDMNICKLYITEWQHYSKPMYSTDTTIMMSDNMMPVSDYNRDICLETARNSSCRLLELTLIESGQTSSNYGHI